MGNTIINKTVLDNINYIDQRLNFINQETKIDYPYQVLEEVEDAQILKR